MNAGSHLIISGKQVTVKRETGGKKRKYKETKEVSREQNAYIADHHLESLLLSQVETTENFRY
jgi:hypothetical protein